METVYREEATDIDVSQFKTISLEFTPLQKLVFHTSFTSSREERVSVLKEAMSSVLAPPRSFSETNFEFYLEGGKVYRWFPT